MTGPFDRKELEDQLVAKDGRTMLALVSIEADGKEPQELQSLLVEAASTIKVEHYYTSEWMINEDQIRSSMEGLAKTEYITVVFILVILFLVFRSAVAPFVPLVVVGLSYLLSQSVVAFLAEYAGFPLSTFTQIFMVAILFGIGTDYCILLISRYKEELASGLDRTEAIVRTYRNAGRTVLISGLAVLIGFASIGFSTFGLYRSAVAVAVGVAVLLLALVTLVPFFMAVLGNALFWPQKARSRIAIAGCGGGWAASRCAARSGRCSCWRSSPCRCSSRTATRFRSTLWRRSATSTIRSRRST